MVIHWLRFSRCGFYYVNSLCPPLLQWFNGRIAPPTVYLNEPTNIYITAVDGNVYTFAFSFHWFSGSSFKIRVTFAWKLNYRAAFLTCVNIAIKYVNMANNTPLTHKASLKDKVLFICLTRFGIFDAHSFSCHDWEEKIDTTYFCTLHVMPATSHQHLICLIHTQAEV